jgi:hypothetical protein
MSLPLAGRHLRDAPVIAVGLTGRIFQRRSGEQEVTVNNPIRLYMSMSLDGFIAGPDDRAGQELGRDGGRLFNWLDDRESDGPSGDVHRGGDLGSPDVRTRRALAG